MRKIKDNKKDSSPKSKIVILIFIITLLFNLLGASAIWSKYHFGKLSINEILYTISMPLKGTSTSIYLNYILLAFIPAVLVTVVLFYLVDKLINFVLPKFSHKKKRIILTTSLSFITVASVIAGIMISDKSWNIFSYISATNDSSTFIEENYVNPNDVDIEFPEQKRNLIYIYLESMETSYQNNLAGGGFVTSRIPELTKLAEENIAFSRTNDFVGAYTTYDATWTIAAMVSQTAGVPLNIPVGRNQMSRFTEFMPGITTLGQILEDNGYKNYIMFGSDKTFAGRDNYYEQHGDYTIYDLYWAIDNGLLPEGENDFWGYQDSRLFEYAKDKLKEISQKDDPFNFTLLTVDTHAQDGYLNEYSSDEFDDQYSNVIRGSSKQVYEFVEWCKTQDWYDDTTIIISGDHLTMDRDYDQLMKEDTQRGVYNCFINTAEETTNKNYMKNRQFTTQDMFPTTLASLGCRIEGNKLGLGTNLYSDVDTLAETYSYEYIDLEFEKTSNFYYKNFLHLNVDDLDS